jgi:hypothetical protein
MSKKYCYYSLPIHFESCDPVFYSNTEINLLDINTIHTIFNNITRDLTGSWLSYNTRYIACIDELINAFQNHLSLGFNTLYEPTSLVLLSEDNEYYVDKMWLDHQFEMKNNTGEALKLFEKDILIPQAISIIPFTKEILQDLYRDKK